MNKKLSLIVLLFILTSVYILPQKTVNFEWVGDFSEGLAPVKLNDKWGFIDVNGNIVVEPKYGSDLDAPFYKNGLTRVYSPEQKAWGYLDKSGNVAIDFKFYSCTPFYDTVAAIYTPGSASDATSYARWSIINRNGEIICNDMHNGHSNSTHFIEGRARISKDFKYGYVDTKGEIVIPNKYEDVRDFSEGLAAVMLDGKWGFIDKDGNVKIDFKFSIEPKSFSNGRTFVQGTNYKFGIIDTEGKVIVDPKYNQVFPFNEGLAVVSEMDKKHQETFFIIDVNGRVIKEFKKAGNDKFYLISGFNEGLAIINKGYGHIRGYVDTKGKTVIDYQFRNIRPFSDGRAFVDKFDNKTREITQGYIDKRGKFVIIVEKPKF